MLLFQYAITQFCGASKPRFLHLYLLFYNLY